ncbi:ATP-binding protein [Escherichia coli]|nr:ATP-binding protein [Escherichia coli]
MKLQQFNIKNYKSIKDEIEVYIDDIVVLIGPNNSGKSTILDAYEKFASLGSAKGLTAHDFYNSDISIPIEMCGIFTDITDDDIRTLGGEKWQESMGEIGRKIIPHWKANSIIVLNGFGHIQKKQPKNNPMALMMPLANAYLLMGALGDLTHYYKVEFLNQ